MDVNLASGVNSGNSRRADRRASLSRRRSSQRFVEPDQFEPKIEWVDTPEARILVADLPGFKKEGVKVHVDKGGNLIISGVRRVEELVFVGGVWHPRERPGCKFRKIFSVPENADTGSITARFETEMLYVTINKLKLPPQIRSVDQESKSILQVGESSGKVAEESGEKKDGKTSSNKPDQDQTPRDVKVETAEVAKSSAAMKETQLEATNKPAELAKPPPSVNKEKPADSNTLQEQPEIMESEQKQAEIKGGGQQEEKSELMESKQEEEKSELMKSKQEEAEVKGVHQHEKQPEAMDSKGEKTQIKAGKGKLGELMNFQKEEAEIKAVGQKPELMESKQDEAQGKVGGEHEEKSELMKSKPEEAEIKGVGPELLESKQNESKTRVGGQHEEKSELMKSKPDAEKKGVGQYEEKPELTESKQEEVKIKAEKYELMESKQEESEIKASGQAPEEKSKLMESKLNESEINAGDHHEEKSVEKPTVESSPPLEDQKLLQPSSEDQIQEAVQEEEDGSSGSDVGEEERRKEKQSIKAALNVSRFMLSRRLVLVVVAIVIYSIALYITYTLRN